MFEKNLDGTLMKMSESLETRYIYEIWFPYTRRTINEIKEGTLIAAPNFASSGNENHYSILEVTTVLPYHYAIQGGEGGYPGFVVEAARSASSDWETQEDASIEDATQIRVVAIPTNLEIVEAGFNERPKVSIEKNVGMLGARVRVLDTEYTEIIANNGIDRKNEKDLTVIGHITRDEGVEILLRIEELYRTHFAIFGFTGVGKSNLLSTIVSKVFEDSSQPLKLVFFDLMSEYSALLFDKLLDPNIQGGVLSVGRNTMPEGLFRYVNQQNRAPDINTATTQLDRYTLLPKALTRHRQLVRMALQDLIQESKIRYFNEDQSTTIWDLFFTERAPWSKNRRGANLSLRRDVVKNVLRNVVSRSTNYKLTPFTPELARRIREGLEQALVQDSTFQEDFQGIVQELQRLESATAENLAAGITLQNLVEDLNDESHPSLWVIQAHNPNALRLFARQLGEEIYENRRLSGRIDPLVSFIFDEADEFIRREGGGSYEESKQIAETLARRGRKFGLGIGIATQRIRYLDTKGAAPF